MPITATCLGCQKRFQAPDAFAGKRVKCRHCGQVFQIPNSGATVVGPISVVDRDVGNDLDHLESMAGLEASAVPRPAGMRTGRNGTKNGGSGAGRSAADRPTMAGGTPPPPSPRTLDPDEQTADADDEQAEEVATAKLAGGRRPNFPVLVYPGAQFVDQSLPLLLVILGLGWLALLAMGDDEAAGLPLIKLARFAIPVLLYCVVIFPILFALLGQAARQLRYNLPPNPKLRAFASYLPAFVLARALWFLGQGSLPGMVVGLAMGLVISSGLLYVLFRLREAEVATTVGSGAAGFAIGAALTVLLILGLNYATGIAVAEGKWQRSVPISPYATGLAWSASPPSEVTTESDMVVSRLSKAHPPPAPVAVPPTPPVGPVANNTPLISNAHWLALPVSSGPGSALLQPLSDAPVLAVLQPAADGSAEVVAWNAVTDQQIGVQLHLGAGQIGPAVMSDDARYLAHIAAFPRRSIHFEAFASGRTMAKIDLPADLEDPALLGFGAPDRLLVRGQVQPDGSDSPLGQALGNSPAATPVVYIVNTRNPRQSPTLRLPPVDPTGFPLAVCAATRRLAVATAALGAPTIVQYDLTTGQELPTRINLDVDRTLPVAPGGFAYTPDGKRLGILLENQGSAALLSYDATTGDSPSELDFPVAQSGHAVFKGNALASMDDNAWVVYGQRVIDAKTGDEIAPLSVANVIDQRVLQGGRIELLTRPSGTVPVVQVLTIDPARYHQLLRGAAATQP